jgi:hypothetical protein
MKRADDLAGDSFRASVRAQLRASGESAKRYGASFERRWRPPAKCCLEALDITMRSEVDVHVC